MKHIKFPLFLWSALLFALPCFAKQEENMNKTLVVYYSVSGNTKQIAEMIQKETNADIFRLETEKTYPHDMEELSALGQKEVNAGYQPTLKALPNVAPYERIVIGTPTWWYKMAPAVLTFFNHTSLQGKEVVLFSTNAGWAGTVIKDMKTASTGATVIADKEILFDSAGGNELQTPLAEIQTWISSWK